MPPSRQARVQVACPHCGHRQPEPPTAFSSICKECGGHFHVQEALKPAPKSAKAAPRKRRITCFECGAELDVPASAESTMCKWCSRYVDLQDYRITVPVAKNFKTKGTFVIEAKGNVFNSETLAGDIIIKGKFKGKLTAERSLTIYSGADVKGALTAARLVIPLENHFAWTSPLAVGLVEIAGEFDGQLTGANTVVLKSTARVFGDVETKNLIVEDGAVLVGQLRIGIKKTESRRRKSKTENA
jgi:cytoskeletal protein CcmA (bactofilin family)